MWSRSHSGALPAIHALAPDAKIYCSAPHGAKGLTAHYGDLGYVPVKTGDNLCIGRRTLQFTQTVMVHWPDNMVTYCPEDRILFSNDAFGQHFASSKRFDDEVGLPEVLAQAKKYYANIVMPYSRHVVRALDALGGLDIDMIAPSHGVIWRSHVAEILETYARWSSLEPEDYAIVVYDSMWHTTETMAREIVEAFVECGVPARLFDLKANHISDIMHRDAVRKYVAVARHAQHGMMPTVAALPVLPEGPVAQGRLGGARRHPVRLVRLGNQRARRGCRAARGLRVRDAARHAVPPVGRGRGAPRTAAGRHRARGGEIAAPMDGASPEKILLIANPASRHGEGIVDAARVEALLRERADAELTVLMTQRRGHAEELAAAAGGFDLVVVVGGDGAAHEVANGLMRIPREGRPAMGVVPAGSGNDYALSLGMSRSLEEAARQLVSAPRRWADLGVCNGRHFIETLSFGLDAAIALDTIERRKRTAPRA